MVDEAASLADSPDKAAYAAALAGAEKFLHDKRVPPPQASALFQKLLMNGVISTYRVAGPIPVSGSASFDASFAPEARPAAALEPFSVAGKVYEWKTLPVTDPQGRQPLVMPDNSVMYLAATVSARADGSAVLSVRSDDGIVIWLNGQKVHSKSIARSVAIAQDQVHVTFRAGENTLLFRINNISGEAGIAARVRHRIGEFDSEEIAAVLDGVQSDAAHGKELFESVGCVKCHTLSPGDAPKGPFLGDAGSKFSRQQLIESILKPSATIAQGYQAEQVIASDHGKRVECIGFVVSDTPEAISIRDINGKVTTLDRGEIKEQKAMPLSLMPQGLGDALSPEEFASLLDYVQSLKGPTPATAPAAPKVP
jgi:putative heme-binding domain-containing protein